MADEKKFTTLRISLVWSSGRRLKRGALLGGLTLVALVVLTLPFLWVDGVIWFIALAAALVAMILIVRAMLFRAEQADILKNGPFIEITQGRLHFPEQLAAQIGLPDVVALKDLETQAWFTQTTFSNGHGYYAQTGYLGLTGGGIDLLLGTGNQTGSFSRLDRLRTDASRERMRGRIAVPVDGKALVTAALFFNLLQEKRASAPLEGNATGPATCDTEKSAETLAEEKVADRLAKMTTALAQGAAVRAAQAANATTAETPTEANILSLLRKGTLRHVPPDLADFVQDWRDGDGGGLLHLWNMDLAVEALLLAGLDAQGRDDQGRTVLMVYGRSAAANRQLIAAGAPLGAFCNQGHNALWHQISPGGIGFVSPDFDGVEALIAAGMPPPTRSEAAAFKAAAQGTVTSGTEHHDWVGYCNWLDRIARGA